jgi:hypothetical protein
MDLTKTDGTERIEELRAFLLGTLAERDVERVEYSLLSDDGLYDLLLATEEDLIDEYLSGALSRSEASSFLGYLNKLPGGRTRIDFSRDLRERLEATETFTSTWRSRWDSAARGLSQLLRGLRPAWAGALLLFLGFAIYASMTYRKPSPLILTAGLTRSEGEIPMATLSAGAPSVWVMLDLGVHSHDRYRATLYDAESRAVFSSEGLTASVTEKRILVAFLIPVAGLEPGDYSISLEGEATSAGYEPLEKYVFRLAQ